jgi:phenylacetate-CoA ligase
LTFWTKWLRLQRSQWLDRKGVESLQVKALRKLVRHAYRTVPFYRKLYDSVSVNPANIESLDDLAKLPMISKEELRASPVEERFSSEFSAAECYVRRTSGSTGQPLQILEENAALEYMRAYQLRRILSYGFKPWERIVVLDPRRVDMPAKGAGFRNPITRIFPSGGGLYHVPMRTPGEQLDAIRQLRPRGIWALPSAMRSIGNLLGPDDSSQLNLRAILSWGELLDRGTRQRVEDLFGASIFDGYGAVEVAPLGGLAWECRDHGFHINADCVILEFVKDGERVSYGERGEVVATSLYRYGMPAIRYKLYDFAIPSDETCTCGRGFPILKSLEGRKVDCLVAETGELVSPFRVIVALEEIEQVGRYQLVQKERDQLLVRIEAKTAISAETEHAIINVCKSLIGNSAQVTLETVSSVTQEGAGKFQPVICKVQKSL